MKYPPLGRIAAMVPKFAVKDLLLGRTLMITILKIYSHVYKSIRNKFHYTVYWDYRKNKGTL